MAVNDVETCSCDIIVAVSGETKEIVNVTCILLVTSGYTHEPGTSTTDHMRRIYHADSFNEICADVTGLSTTESLTETVKTSTINLVSHPS